MSIPVALSVLLVGSASSSSADTTRGTVLATTKSVRVIKDGDWTRHEFTTKLSRSELGTVRGTRLVAPDGSIGCAYRGSDAEPANALKRGEVRLSREVASNLSTCELVLETATVSAQDPALAGAPTLGNEQESELRTSPNLTTNATTTGKYQKLYYEDPPQIDVTSVTVRLRWTWTGSCTTWSQHQAAWGWFSTKGWSRTQSWWGYEYANCAYGATTSNSGQYKNTKFCLARDTWNQYYTNYLQGKSNGATYYQWDAQKWGGCVDLLSFHRAVGTW